MYLHHQLEGGLDSSVEVGGWRLGPEDSRPRALRLPPSRYEHGARLSSADLTRSEET